MFPPAGKSGMTDLSSVTSSISAAVTKQAANLKQAADATTGSFSSALTRVETTIGVKPKAGFISGPTYEANQAKTLAGQTKTAFTNTVNTVFSTTVNVAKATLNIK
jgi:hypothetical protein